MAVLFGLWVCGSDVGEEGWVRPFVWDCFECAGAEADGIVEPVGEEDADVGVGLVVEGSGIFWRGGGDAEEVGDVFGEGKAPLSAKGGDTCGEDFEVGWRELGRVSGRVGKRGREYLGSTCDDAGEDHRGVWRVVGGSMDVVRWVETGEGEDETFAVYRGPSSDRPTYPGGP